MVLSVSNQKRAVFAALFLCALPLHSQKPSPVSKPQIVLTSLRNGLEPMQEMSCEDTIHGYLRLPQRVQGEHTMEATWFDPQGKAVEHANIPIKFSRPSQSAYIWLALQKRTSSVMDDLDTNTAPNNLYNGLWRVNVTFDGTPLIDKNFKIRCS